MCECYWAKLWILHNQKETERHFVCFFGYESDWKQAAVLVISTCSSSMALLCCFSRHNWATWMRTGRGWPGFWDWRLDDSFLHWSACWQRTAMYQQIMVSNEVSSHDGIFFIWFITVFSQHFTWLVYMASKALLRSMACSCFFASLYSTPSAFVNFTFFFESNTFWSCAHRNMMKW